MILASSCIIHSFNLQATFKNTGQCNDKQDNQAETALKVALENRHYYYQHHNDEIAVRRFKNLKKRS